MTAGRRPAAARAPRIERRREKPRSSTRLLLRAAGFLLLGLLAYVLFTLGEVWWASNQDAGGDPAQAIVVLGAAQYDGRPSPVLERRLDHAFDLWAAGTAPYLVVTGGNQEGDRFTEAAASYGYLRSLGVPDEWILREEDGTNTWEQLAAVARFLPDRGIDEVVLVSDDYHAFRLEIIARELGLDADVSPVSAGLSAAGEARALARETAAVSVGRIIGYRRLVDLESTVGE